MNRRHFFLSLTSASGGLLAVRAASGSPRFFTVAQREGRWRFVTPEGEPFFSIGLNHIGEPVENWRTEMLYEYFWERWAPSTPTLHALITPRWKYVRAYGLWDVPELYDLETDPHELNNLFTVPEHRQRAMEMDQRLFELLAETGGDSLPLHRGWKGSAKEERSPAGSGWAPFPKSMTGSPER